MCRSSRNLSKVALAVLTLLFWFASAALIFVAVWVYKEYGNYRPFIKSVHILAPATIILAAGVFIFIVGLLGCVGAMKENRCLLASFFSLLLIILAAEGAGCVLAYIYRFKIHDAVEDSIKEGMTKYETDKVWRTDVDFMQKELDCCGLWNATDWKTTDWYSKHNVSYPESCCENQHCHYHANHTGVYTEGCLPKMKEKFMDNLAAIAGLAAAFAVIQFIGMICSCVLFCQRRSEVPYIGLQNPSGLRV